MAGFFKRNSIGGTSIKMNGTILGMIGNDILMQDNDTQPNRNIIGFGGPGSRKTQSVVLTNIFSETENSIVVTDPKGNVYEKTVWTKIKQGYTPYLINFDDMVHSNWYNPFDYISRDIHANEVANKIVESGNKESKKDIWYYSQRALLKALILYVIHESPPVDRNLRGIIQMLQFFDMEKDDAGKSELDKTFGKLDIAHPARRAYDLGIKKAKGETHSGIVISLLTTLADYVDEEVANFTSFSDFDLKDIGRKKIILYIKIPVLKKTFEPLTNLFLTQLFDQLYELGDENFSKLPRNVDFILEEFVNLGEFPNYEEFLATCREYGIGVITICQTLTQLQSRYGREKAESILGNNAVKICISAANNTTAKYFSELLGKATVKVETGGRSHSQSNYESTGTNDNYSYISRDLMTPDEIQNMPIEDEIIHFTGKKAMRIKKAFQYNLFPHADEHLISRHEYTRKSEKKQLDQFKAKEIAFMRKTEQRIKKLQSNADSFKEIDKNELDMFFKI